MQHRLLPLIRSDTLLYFESVNITFQQVQLINTDTSSFAQILRFFTSSVRINNLVSSGCSTTGQIIHFYNCSDANGDQSTEITNSVFENGQGRALLIESSDLILRNTSFDGFNTSNGGAMQVVNTDIGSLLISNCTFANNIAFSVDDDNDDIGFGGAMFVHSPRMTVTSTLFVNNSARWNGGAVYMESKSELDSRYWPGEYATFDACQFTSNIVQLRGGPIYYVGSQGHNNETITINNSQFSHHYQGPTVYIAPGPNFWGVTFVVIDGCTFSRNNNVYVYGYFRRVTTLFVLNSIFMDNIGVYNMSDATSDRKGDINEAGEVAGVHAAWCQCVGVYNTTFANNLGAGLALRNIMGDCESRVADLYPPLFNRSTIAGIEGSQWIINSTNTDGLTPHLLTLDSRVLSTTQIQV